MIILTIQNLHKAFGGNVVLKDVNMVLQDHQRMGLVGVNGCGKSTLLKILAGKEQADGGSVSLAKGMKIGYMEQQYIAREGATVFEELQSVYEPVFAMEEKMRALEARMAEVSDEKELIRLGDSYARLSDAFEKADGYAWRSLIHGVLSGLGFQKEQFDQPAHLLSGGELTRLCLAKLLLQKPDLLLLDEPTNHLDLAALDWLEKYLSEYSGALIVVSHDRYFLDHVCTHITELLLGVAEQYEGNYSRYMPQRTERFEIRMRAWEQQQKLIAREEAIIARYKSFNREKSIRAAESREKRLEKIERLERPEDEHQVRFRFEANRRTGDDVLSIQDFSKSFGDRILFSNVNINIRAGDRIALLGPNGIGKSTLLRCLIGELAPDTGFVRWGANVDMGYYDQQQKSLHPDKTVLDEVWDAFPRLEQSQVRGALGLFLFTGDDVFSPIRTLSGGEKGRVALTKLMLHKDNLLLLDEPTNHLDMDSREVLEDALDNFEGTILAVSHDRYFINRFATKVLVLGPDGVKEYLGNFDDYQARLQWEASQQDVDPRFAEMTRTEAAKEKKKMRLAKEQQKALKEAVKAAEQAVSDAEEAIEAQEALMATPEIYAVPEKAAEAAREYQRLKAHLADCYARWEAAEEALEESIES
ncbi:MAG: ABC-F family ATP-binding cassette domain-containing protein [Clostridiales bacterium]|nr:ABC-F family ATP-binding cassette domain-containing protein [Clostridiales bacterium]